LLKSWYIFSNCSGDNISGKTFFPLCLILTTDQIINFDGKIPKEVVLEDKTAIEQMKLIQQLDDEDKQTILRLIDKMLTNKKFKDFFQKKIKMLQN
jgi:hypothetical protein